MRIRVWIPRTHGKPDLVKYTFDPIPLTGRCGCRQGNPWKFMGQAALYMQWQTRHLALDEVESQEPTAEAVFSAPWQHTPSHTRVYTAHTHFLKCMKQLCLARRAVQRGWQLWIGFPASSYSNCCFLGPCFLQREGERARFLFRSNWLPSVSHSLSLCVEFNLRLSLRSPFLTRNNKGHLCSSSDPTQCPNAPKIISE